MTEELRGASEFFQQVTHPKVRGKVEGILCREGGRAGVQELWGTPKTQKSPIWKPVTGFCSRVIMSGVRLTCAYIIF